MKCAVVGGANLMSMMQTDSFRNMKSKELKKGVKS